MAIFEGLGQTDLLQKVSAATPETLARVEMHLGAPSTCVWTLARCRDAPRSGVDMGSSVNMRIHAGPAPRCMSVHACGPRARWRYPLRRALAWAPGGAMDIATWRYAYRENSPRWPGPASRCHSENSPCWEWKT